MWSEMNGKTPTDSELQRFTKLFPITSIPTSEDNENHSEENFSGILYGSSIDYWIGCLGLVDQTGGCVFFTLEFCLVSTSPLTYAPRLPRESHVF